MKTKICIVRDVIRFRMLNFGLSFGLFVTRIFPFIRLMAISGSLTNPNYKRHNDIDYFIVVRKGHVWDTFIINLLLARIFAKVWGINSNSFCFNYIIDETHVLNEIEINEKSAYEFLNLILIKGHKEYLRISLFKRNSLIRFYPKRFENKIKRVMKYINYNIGENSSFIGILSGTIFSILGKLASWLLMPLIKIRENRYRELLKRIGYDYRKVYSNKLVYRRHKK